MGYLMTFHRNSAGKPRRPSLSYRSRDLLSCRLGRSPANPILFHSIQLLRSPRQRYRKRKTNGHRLNRIGMSVLRSESFLILSSISACVEVSSPAETQLGE